MAYRRTGPSSVIDSLGSPLDDEPVGRLPVARLVSLGRHAPWRHGMTSARGLAFTAAERMIHRVHRHAADVRALAEPAAPARLANRHVLMVDVADLPDGRLAVPAAQAHLPRARPGRPRR